MLDEVGAGQIEPHSVVSGPSKARQGRVRGVEAPYLQLVHAAALGRGAGARARDVLRQETLERLGGAQHIVEEHLQGALDGAVRPTRRTSPGGSSTTS